MQEKIEQFIKSNKTVIVVILISFLPIYFFSIRPSQIKKQCSQTVAYDSYQYTNPAYNETTEKQKQNMLVDYIQCRNNNLLEEDQVYINKDGHNPYPLTQEQYNNLSISELLNLIEKDKYKDLKDKESAETSEKLFGGPNGLEKLNQYALGKLSTSLYHTYNGYIMDIPTYEDLKENSKKYPQCNFPDDFVAKKLWGGNGKYYADASDAEYKSCLRKNGL